MNLQDIVKKWMEFLSPDDKKEQNSKKIENLDAKMVFQDTKKSLEELKLTIFSQEDLEKRKEQEQHLSQYIDRLLWFSVLSKYDKTFLNQLKKNILTKNSLQEADVESIIKIVSHLEQKAETLSELDQEKVKELNETLSQHKTSLDLLKKGVAAVAPSLDEAKKKTFETMKTDLEKHRRSSRLAQPVYDYLMDKHVHKKSVSKFKDWLMGTVWLTVVGWFVWKDLKNLISNIDNLKVEGIVDNLQNNIDEIKKSLTDLPEEKINNLRDIFRWNIWLFFENKFGKKIDKQKLDEAFDEWFDEFSSDMNFRWKYEEVLEKAQSRQGEFDTMEEIFWLVSMPFSASFGFLMKLKEKWLISAKDIFIDCIAKPWWKIALNVWLWSIGLFANTIKMAFWSISAEDFSEYMEKYSDRFGVEDKQAVWWILYRRGWWFWNLAWRVWDIVWSGVSLLFTERTGGDVSRTAAYWKWWLWWDLATELKVFEQLEKNLIKTNMFSKEIGEWWYKHLNKIMDTWKNNNTIFDIMQNTKTTVDLEKKLIKSWNRELLKKLKYETVNWTLVESIDWKNWNFKSIRTKVWNNISTEMEHVLKYFDDSLDSWQKFMKNKFNMPWSKIPYEQKIVKQLRDYSKLQDKLLHDDQMFKGVRNFFRKFDKAKQLSTIINASDNTSLRFSNAKEAKDFFDNLKVIGRSSPEILKTLFKWFPIIMLSREVMNKISDPENKDGPTKAIIDWLMYMTPFVWPIKLVSEWVDFDFEKWEFKSLASAWIWVWLFTLDGYYAWKATKVWWFAWFSKFLLSPIRDTISFMKSVGQWTYISLKMWVDGVRLIRAGKWAQLWIEWLKFLKNAWLKLWWLAILGYLWCLGWQEIFDDANEEEKKQLKELSTMTNAEFNTKISEKWNDMDDKEKSVLIKVAVLEKMSLSDLDSVDIKKSWENISILFNKLVNYNEMKNVESELQEAFFWLEATKNIKFDFKLNGWEVKYELLAIKKNNFVDEQWKFDQNSMEKYLMAMWYNQELVGELMKKII